MNMMKKNTGTSGHIERPASRLMGITLHFFLPLIALVCGIAITYYLLHTGPQARPGRRPATAILVEVELVRTALQPTKLSAMGQIIAAREIEMKPQVSGEVLDINNDFMPGGHYQAGQTMLTIERTDYELVVRQLESEVARAESDLTLEMGNQRIAERELELLGQSVSTEEKNLILRLPQLEKLKASRDSAQARLDQARLDLERTEIRAPFNGVITSRMVDKGAKVTASTVLAKYIGTDSFWLQLSLPVEQLRWLKIPSDSTENGAKVHIYAQGSTASDTFRTGEVVRLNAALEVQGRMAQLLVKIDDPLCLKDENKGRPMLLLGSYVQAEIEGIAIDSGISIKRSHLHDGNSVWLMDDSGMLDIRPVEIAFRDRDSIIVSSGIKDGERLVVSALSSPIKGTPLRLLEAGTDVPEEKPIAVSGKGSSKPRGEKRDD